MDNEQARAFLEEANQYGSIYGLDRIRNLMARLQDVQEQLDIIHVAGTNGKGSVCAMLAGILQAVGYRTGVYASPAVFEPEEIMTVNGIPISQDIFTRLAGKVQSACKDMIREGLPHPTAFEVETAIAFCFFKEKDCDYVVLETGLGGEEDATNLITHPVCSVLTSISKDHMAILGETLTEIAAAKAGIIKSGCPCVTAVQKPEVLDVVVKAATAKGSELRVADETQIRHFMYDGNQSRFEFQAARTYDSLKNSSDETVGEQGRGLYYTVPLAGACQKENLACVWTTVQLLRDKGIAIPQKAVREGLAGIHLPGRFEKLQEAPDFYIDGAHNEGAAVFLQKTVQNCFTKRRIIYIMGVLADKEYEKLLKLMLPYASQVFTVTPDNPRALDGRKLAQQAAHLHSKVTYVPEVSQAAKMAIAAAGKDGVVLAFGSFSYLKELKRTVEGKICET